ncbi:MAG: NAD(P)-dependent oxidoreductase [Leptospirales bacterium]
MTKRMKVFISNYPFARYDEKVLTMLQKSGLTVEVNPYGRKMKPEETAVAAAGADIIIAGTENLDKLVARSKSLKMISRIGIGLDSVPLDLCKEKNILVAYTPDAVTEAVADLTVGMMIDSLRSITKADKAVRRKNWVRPYGKSVSSCTIGIIGFGRVGFRVARHLVSFSPRFLVNDIDNIDDKIKQVAKAGGNIEFASASEIYKNSDVVTLHVPLTSGTFHMVNHNTLSLMKKSAVLLNLSRGDLIHENDLYQALMNEQIFQAGIDVFSDEPYKGKLLELDNIVLTQHMGACTFEGRNRMEVEATKSVLAFASGKKVLRTVPESEYRYQSDAP